MTDPKPDKRPTAEAARGFDFFHSEKPINRLVFLTQKPQTVFMCTLGGEITDILRAKMEHLRF
jgi:hypothetical protein